MCPNTRGASVAKRIWSRLQIELLSPEAEQNQGDALQSGPLQTMFAPPPPVEAHLAPNMTVFGGGALE